MIEEPVFISRLYATVTLRFHSVSATSVQLAPGGPLYHTKEFMAKANKICHREDKPSPAELG